MSGGKIAKALIGGNWKCNGTVASVKAMAEVLNKAGPFSANSEVVIAAPSIHLAALKSYLRPDVAVSAEVMFSISVTFNWQLLILFCPLLNPLLS